MFPLLMLFCDFIAIHRYYSKFHVQLTSHQSWKKQKSPGCRAQRKYGRRAQCKSGRRALAKAAVHLASCRLLGRGLRPIHPNRNMFFQASWKNMLRFVCARLIANTKKKALTLSSKSSWVVPSKPNIDHYSLQVIHFPNLSG